MPGGAVVPVDAGKDRPAHRGFIATHVLPSLTDVPAVWPSTHAGATGDGDGCGIEGSGVEGGGSDGSGSEGHGGGGGDGSGGVGLGGGGGDGGSDGGSTGGGGLTS